MNLENKIKKLLKVFYEKHESHENDNKLVNIVFGLKAAIFYDSNYSFYAENTKKAEYFFDKYFTLLENVNVNCMNLENPWIKKMWKLNIDWLKLIANTTQEHFYLERGLECLILSKEDLSTSLQTWVAIDINKNQVVSLRQWGYWRKDEEGLVNWLRDLAKIPY